MKVYVVIGYIDYEGYTEPSAVFDSREKAEEYIKQGFKYSTPEIFEMEVK